MIISPCGTKAVNQDHVIAINKTDSRSIEFVTVANGWMVTYIYETPQERDSAFNYLHRTISERIDPIHD